MNDNLPATPGFKLALSAEVAVQETSGNRDKPAMFKSS
jgi:hypothetical protein